MTPRSWCVIAALLVACGKDDDAASGDTDAPIDDVGVACGNGAVEAGEQCDDGEKNDDTVSDACRHDCRLPSCGDAVADEGEACDDGNPLGGDGCDPQCHVESGDLEAEPNDTTFLATALDGATTVTGGLSAGDIDCYAVDIVENGFLSARVSLPDGACTVDAVLRVFDEDDDEVTYAYPGAESDDVCAHVDPLADDDARYLHAGRYTVCVEGLFRSSVPTYRLGLEVGDDSCLSGGTTSDSEDDLDGDKLADPCDADDDGDSVLDDDDNCPRMANGGASAAFNTTSGGWIRQWLIAGPFTGNTVGPGGSCDPSVAPLLGGEDDGLVVPALGDDVGSLAWRAWIARSESVDFTKVYTASGDRESYAVAWVRVPTEREAVFAYGADDGSMAWLDGVLLGRDPTCHGVVNDDLEYDVDLTAGWHRVMIKIRDHGGGWGVKARFKSPTGSAMTDLEVSLTADTPWFDDQGDRDGDGTGDVCDTTP